MRQSILITGILFLLVGVSVVSSADYFGRDITTNYRPLISTDNLEEILLNDNTAYAYLTYSNGSLSEGFYSLSLDAPGNLNFINPLGGGSFLSGGTWTNDGKWFCCYYGDGILVEVDPEDGGSYIVGGGGTGLNGLAYNPVNNKLYGASSDGSSGDLFEININTGEQTYIGSFVNTVWMIGIAFDANGILYGWDVGNDSLWTIDTDTGQASLVGPLGIDIKYAQDGAFDYDNDILYLSAYTESPSYGGYLYECDEDTGSCDLIGPFEGYAELDAFAIPYNWSGPTADFYWEPLVAEPYMPVNFNASDSYDPDGYITLYEWDWDDDGIFDENHTSPNTTHTWEDTDEFPVTLRVTDNDGLMGMKTKYVLVYKEPPESPSITGPTSGKIGVTYDYKFVSFHPDGDDLSYFIDWGDNTTTGWTDYYACGEWITQNHSWSEKGEYEILAKVKDYYGGESPWSMLKVTMPRGKSISNSLLLRFLEQYPLLNRLINLLIK